MKNEIGSLGLHPTCLTPLTGLASKPAGLYRPTGRTSNSTRRQLPHTRRVTYLLADYTESNGHLRSATAHSCLLEPRTWITVRQLRDRRRQRNAALTMAVADFVNVRSVIANRWTPSLGPVSLTGNS